MKACAAIWLRELIGSQGPADNPIAGRQRLLPDVFHCALGRANFRPRPDKTSDNSIA